MTQLITLSNEKLAQLAPSIFAAQPFGTCSDKYAFMPTTTLIEELKDNGWMPVSAREQSVTHKSMLLGRKGYQKHVIRFAHAGEEARELVNVGDTRLELMLSNSHDGTSRFEFHAAAYRKVCSNGLIVADSLFAKASIKHIGFKMEDAMQAVNQIAATAPRINESIHGMQSVQLDGREQLMLAEAALDIKYADGDHRGITPAGLLQPRRYGDTNKDLWTTFNVVQENMLRGGVRGRSATGRRTRTRPITSIGEDVRLNKALWTLAEKMREIKNS